MTQRRHHSGVGEQAHRPQLVEVEQDRLARRRAEQVSDDAVGAAGAAVHHAGVTRDHDSGHARIMHPGCHTEVSGGSAVGEGEEDVAGDGVGAASTDVLDHGLVVGDHHHGAPGVDRLHLGAQHIVGDHTLG